MPRIVKIGIRRPATQPLLPDPLPREVKYTFISVDDHLVEPPDTFKDACRENSRHVRQRSSKPLCRMVMEWLAGKISRTQNSHGGGRDRMGGRTDRPTR